MKKCYTIPLILFFFVGLQVRSIAQSYCYPSFSTGCSSGDSITSFSIGSYTRSWTKCYTGGLDSTKATSSVINLYRGKTYTVKFTTGVAESFGLYLDYNKNGSFSDAAELLTSDNNGTFSSFSQDITIPIDAAAMTTRMRLFITPGANTIAYNTGCTSSYSKGAIQDYLVNITGYSNDIAIMSLLTPQNLGCPSANEKITVLIRNIGTSTLTSIPITIVYGTTTINATYNRTLISNTEDTFTVGSINASVSGTYKFKVYTNLTNDGDRTNDTISASVDLKQPSSPTVTSVINHCGSGSMYIYAKSTSGGSSTYWFNSISSSAILANADSFKMPYTKMGQSVTYYAESRYPGTNYLQKSTFNTAKANYGNMFDVYAKANITADSFDVNFSSTGKDSAIIYYKLGSYQGYDRTASAWTLAGTFYCLAQGGGNSTKVVMNKGINLTNGKTYGFYIVPYSGQAYYDQTYATSNPKSNGEMTITAGESLGSLFLSGSLPGGGTGTTVATGSRDWAGTIYYHYATCGSARVSTTINMLQNPNGSAISKGTPFMGKFNAGTAKNTDFICLGDTNTYVLTPPSGLANSDFGTKWVITSLSFATASGATTKDTILRLPTATKSGYMKFFPSSNADSTFILKATIKITATGCDSTLVRYVKVYAQPKASFTTSNGCTNKILPITNSSTPTTASISYLWTFGNGDSSVASTPYYKYFNTGTYTVTVTAVNGSCVSTASHTVTVSQSPYGSVFSKSSPFGGAFNTGDIFDPDNLCATDTNVYQISAPKGLSNSDYGTKWKIANISFGTIWGNKNTDTIFKRPTSTRNATFSFFPAAKWADSIFLLRFSIQFLPGNCDSFMTRYVHVRFKPSAYFSFNNACLGLPLTFKDTSKVNVSSIQAWNWSFGDGASSINQNPSHSYVTAKTYNVKLSVVTDVGCSSSITKTVEQYPRPTAKFGTGLVCNTTSGNFIDSSTIATGSVNGWKWSFGDGGSSALQNPTHIYSKSGPYTVKLVSISAFGCKDSLTKKVRVYPTPSVAYTYLNACVGGTLYFANNSYDSAGKTVYSWDFGDSTTTGTAVPTHVYKNNGTYTVRLNATSGNGCKNSTSQNITPNPKPIPKITFVPVCVGQTASFIDSSGTKGGTLTWNFGDGSTVYISKLSSADHSYSKAGAFNVKLNIVSSGGCADSQTKAITIVDYPKPAFTANSVCIGKTTTFTNTTTGAAGYLWDFGDGSNSTQQNTNHIYSTAGNYQVTLRATNSLGCYDSLIKTVTVNSLPVIGKWTRDQKGYTVTFIPQDSTIGNFKWHFGTPTNDSSSLKKPTFTYPTADGRYQVKVIVTSPAGCSFARYDSIFMGKYGIPNQLGGTGEIIVYPNPFKGTTTISYNLTSRSKVLIRVYDVQGKEIAKLKDGYFNAGKYEDSFDASKYKAVEGVYFLKMYIDDTYYTTRIVNMK
jgi:PKD repeat protein